VVLAAGYLTLDLAQHRVAHDGTRIELTPREYGGLEFLMRRKGLRFLSATSRHRATRARPGPRAPRGL